MSQPDVDQGEVPVVELEDPEYDLDPELAKKRQQQVSGDNFRLLVSNNLSKLSRTFDGRSYAYTSLDLTNKRLFQLNGILVNYAHLRSINLQQNFLTQFDHVLHFKYLIKLDMSDNKIEDIRSLDNEDILPCLQELNLSRNKINRLVRVPLKRLKVLKMNNNQIHSIELDGSQSLQVLELRSNRIKDVTNLSNMPKLTELYLADNLVENISTMHDLPSLQLLHLRKNKLQRIEQKVDLPKLCKLNLRQNNVTKLQSLGGLPQSLNNLNLLGNPISEELGDNVRKEVWMLHRHYNKINKVDIEEEDKLDFDREYRERLEELEKLRLEKETQQRQAKQLAERQLAEKAAQEKAQKEAAELQRQQQEKQKQAEDQKIKEQELSRERERKGQQNKVQENAEDEDNQDDN